MATYTISATYEYDNFGGFWVTSPVGLTDPDGPLDFTDADGTFNIGEDISGAGNIYIGYITIDGLPYPVVTGPGGDTSNAIVAIPDDVDASTITFPSPVDTNNTVTSPFVAANLALCFAAGTLITTTLGQVPVESLTEEHVLVTADDKTTKALWIGRQTMFRRFSGSKALNMVRISEGALGNGLPETDLTLTGDHGMIVDGYVVNASAMVNRTSIQRLSVADLPESFCIYHVETENHDVILANGAPAESFIDAAGRTTFENYDEYLALNQADRLIPEMPLPRISSARHLPRSLKTRLGIADDTILTDLESVA